MMTELQVRQVLLDFFLLEFFLTFFIQALFHSGYSIAPRQVHYYSEALPTTARSFTPMRHRQLRVKELPKVGYLRNGKAGFEPATLRTQGTESTNLHVSLALCFYSIT